MVKYCTYRNNELTYKTEWKYNYNGLLKKIITNTENSLIEIYTICYKYDYTKNTKIISE